MINKITKKESTEVKNSLLKESKDKERFRNIAKAVIKFS